MAENSDQWYSINARVVDSCLQRGDKGGMTPET